MIPYTKAQVDAMIRFHSENAKRCTSCGAKIVTQRDNSSPYCDTCDPNGVRRFFDLRYHRTFAQNAESQRKVDQT